MKTNKLFNILSAATLVLGLSACVKEAPKYEPAEKPTTAEVYFSTDLVSNYDIAPDQNYFNVQINRANTTSDYTATITSTAPEGFKVNNSVTFPKGLISASVKIEYDPAKLVDGQKYTIDLVASSEASQYGKSKVSVTATYTVPKQGSDWEPFMTTTPAFVENIMKCYSSSIDTHTFECYVEKFKEKDIYRIVNPMSQKVYNGKTYANPYYDATASKAGIWPEEFLNQDDYYIIIDMDGKYYAEENKGAALEAGNVYIAESNLNFQWEDDGPFNIVSAAVWPNAKNYASNTVFFGEYDATKKCFKFNDYLVCCGNSIYSWPAYSGCATSYLYLDKNLMKENYNEYPTEDWASANVESTIFGKATDPAKFASDVKIWIDGSVKKGNNCVYFLPDYFQDGNGLAFMAPDPDKLTDGASITDVANEQEVGELFGTKLYANIKKGTVTIPDGGYPVFEVQVSLFATQEGAKVVDYGTFTEKIAISSFVEKYTKADIRKSESKEEFLGVYSQKVNDYYNAAGAIIESSVPVIIEDAGQDEEGDWVAITGLTGTGYTDTVYGTFEDGNIFVAAQTLDDAMYGYTTYFTPFDPDQFMYNQKSRLELGFVPNGHIAIVAETDGYSGAYFYCSAGGIAINWGYVLSSLEEDASASATVKSNGKINTPIEQIVRNNRKMNLGNGQKYVESGKDGNHTPVATR